MDAQSFIPYGTSASRGEAHTLHYELRYPHPVDAVWRAVATPGGLRSWLAATGQFEPGPGGAVALRWLGDDDGGAVLAPGRITAWKKGRLVEYTVDVYGTVRFALRASGGEADTLVRFSNDFTGSGERRLDALVGWHRRFETLAHTLAGTPAHPADPAHATALRAAYAERT
ncbi:SRPBCC domain-containing protein [Streptomyces daliensis]